MPVATVTMCEGPCYSMDSQTVRYLSILIDISIIIVVNEAVSNSLAKDQPDDRDEENA